MRFSVKTLHGKVEMAAIYKKIMVAIFLCYNLWKNQGMITIFPRHLKFLKVQITPQTPPIIAIFHVKITYFQLKSWECTS